MESMSDIEYRCHDHTIKLVYQQGRVRRQDRMKTDEHQRTSNEKRIKTRKKLQKLKVYVKQVYVEARTCQILYT